MATLPHAATERAATTHRGSFVKMPTAVLYDDRLSDGDIIAYAVLRNYAWALDTQTIRPFEMTADQLAALLGKSRRRATERVAALKAAGWLKVDGRRGLNQPNRYTVVAPDEFPAARKRPTQSVENDATGSAGNDAPGWVENDAPSTTTDRRDENTLALVDGREPCGHCDHGWREDDTGRARRCGCLDSPPAF